MFFKRKRSAPAPSAPQLRVSLDPALINILNKCGGRLPNVARYIISTYRGFSICQVCPYADGEQRDWTHCNGANCVEAAIKYMEAHDGNS